MKKIKFVTLAVISLVVVSCSQFKRLDDAVRIKPDSAAKYEYYSYDKSKARNGLTLRGTVLRIRTFKKANSCPITDTTTYSYRTHLYFLDSASSLRQIESIPIEDVDLIGPKFDTVFNIFEQYNYPLDHRHFRKVLVDTISKRCDACECDNFDFDLLLKCPEPRCTNWFFEIRGGYSIFRDIINTNLDTSYKEALMGEAAAGFRFGKQKQFGLGLAINYGMNVANSFKNVELIRPLALLHFRWDPFKLCPDYDDPCQPCTKEPDSPLEILPGLKTCIRPFIFGQIGMAFDELTMNLAKINFNEECRQSIPLEVPYIDMGFPVSYSLGCGLDFPVSTTMDISVDLSYRSVAFGESVSAFGYSNIPTLKRINFMLFRFGITL